MSHTGVFEMWWGLTSKGSVTLCVNLKESEGKHFPDLMKSTAVDESLSSMNQQFCSRENQLLQAFSVCLLACYQSYNGYKIWWT